MSRKQFILIISAAIIILGIIIYFLISSSNTNQGVATQNTSNPFGDASGNKTSNNIGKNTATDNSLINNGSEKNLAQLTQIYKSPTSGTVFFVNKNNQNVLRFVDRAVGNVYEYLPSSQTGRADRVTNTTIPKIQEAIWSNTGENLILRYLDNNTDNIISFSAKIKNSSSSNATTTPGEITGIFLSPNIKEVVINPKGDKIFSFVEKSDKSGSYGYISNLDGSNKKIIFNSPVTYWNVSWPKDSTIIFTTKPSYNDAGISYLFNTQNYSMNRILGNIVGLSTATNKTADLVAYSSSADSFFYLDIYDIKNRISEGYKIDTLADKCVWGNNNSKILYCAIPDTGSPDNYPDAWYQGLESFSDNVWKIDTETGNVTEIYQIGSNESASIDAMNLTISSDDQYLAFMNKNDLSLWLLQLK